MELLSHFSIASRQLMPNSWRIVISFMEIWLAVTKGDMIRVDEFRYLYHLKESKKYRYYELMPWVRKARIFTDLPRPLDTGSLGSFLCTGTTGRPLMMNFGVTFLGCSGVGEPRV